MTLAERYAHFCATPSSINQHLPLLRDYAARCHTVAEFGVQYGASTTAFLMGQPEMLISVDCCRMPELEELFKLLRGDSYIGKTQWFFRHDDSRTVNLPEVDLLLIDSAHCHAQIEAELALHHTSVRRWIMCHDYIAYGTWGEAGPPQEGIMRAITEFLGSHSDWREHARIPTNNGLFIMERVNDR